ncbi:rbr-type e3 ubiquitin transferase [Anaeramoeba flamelloides]|uniref:RBR-type E3 ubiquitin transferase n=1 Tax=Anaeramoeba flamelloides TaxID=1746091 RepID=A0ABQ8X978_9EUKA|nr:rbr-type e3 ubiquitin transferase [Anaeramoeba flamelloides]
MTNQIETNNLMDLSLNDLIEVLNKCKQRKQVLLKEKEHLKTEFKTIKKKKKYLIKNNQNNKEKLKKSLKQINKIKTKLFEDEKIVIQTLEDEKYAKKLESIYGPFLCEICYVQNSMEDVFHVTACGHKICSTCATRYCEIEIRSRKLPIMCPICKGKKVKTIIPDNNILNLRMDQKVLNQYYDFSLGIFVDKNPEKCCRCPKPNCGKPMFFQDNQVEMRCYYCDYHYCRKCNVEWHDGSTCEQFQKWKLENDDADRAFEEYKNSIGAKQCPKCGAVCSKTAGCNKMTCGACHCYWCYKCEALITDRDPYQHFRGSKCDLYN